MSVQRRRAKAAKRQAEYQKHGAQKVFPCSRCGEPGPHFVPPSFGDIGFFLCDPPADIHNHTRCENKPSTSQPVDNSTDGNDPSYPDPLKRPKDAKGDSS